MVCMYVITFANPKGGSGKTTSAMLLAEQIALSGGQVSILDLDPNANILAWSEGRKADGRDVPFAVHARPQAEDTVELIDQLSGETDYLIIDLPPEWRGSIDTINTLEVRGKSADPLPLRDFVQVTRGVGADMLEHTDGLRSATFTAGVAPGHTAAEAFAALLPLTTQALDPGMKPVLGGDAAKAGAESGSAGTVLLLALVFIYFILGEHILPSTYIGLVLIMMGLWIQQKKVKDREEALNLG